MIKEIKKIIERYRNWKLRQIEFPIDFVGGNWRIEDDKPIAVMFGFNPWKREVISKFLKEYKTAFVYGNTKYSKVRREFIKKFPPSQRIIFISWGNKLPFLARVDAFFNKRKKYSIEDGFLRSIGSGLLHTRPSSICIDARGIYFDATSKSDLENIISDYDFDSDPQLIERAKNCIDIFRAARLTKYYDTHPYLSSEKFKKTGRYSVLVIGQVEDDASIIKGRVKISRNVELVLQAKRDFPDADVYFRPHPDFWAGNRKSYSNIKKVSKICAIVPPENSLYELFSVVDHVYTMTSLAGFEALLNGLKVTTFGVPFYAGWGLTDDRVKIKRRKRKISIEQLFASAYLLYPRYLHQASDENVSFEETSGYFIVDVLKDNNIFKLEKENILFQKTIKYKEILSAPFRLMVYLNETDNFAAADTKIIIEILRDKFKLSDYAQASYLLYKTSNYDALVEYSNICIDYLDKNKYSLKENSSLLENFLYNLSLALLNSNGRVINSLPNINDLIINIIRSNNYNKIIENYINCLAYNLQYEVIDDLFDKIEIKENSKIKPFRAHWNINDFINEATQIKINYGNYRNFAQIFSRKPSRSERNFAKRHQIILRVANKYLEDLNVKFNSAADAIFNQLLYWTLLDENSMFKQCFSELSAFFEEAGDKKFEEFVKYRKAEFLAFAHICLKYGYFSVCEKIIDKLSFDTKDLSIAFLRISYLRYKGKESEFLNFFEKLPEDIKNEEKIIGVYAKYLREVGMLERSKQCYLEMYKKAKTVAKKSSVIQEVQKLTFCQESSAILNSVAQPKLPKGVIVLASQTCFNTLAMMIPSLVELKKKGYAVINLMAGMTENEPTGIEYIDKFAGAIPLRLAFFNLQNEWEIHWNEKKVISKKINFYQGFYEGLSVYARRFHVDINAPLINRIFMDKLYRADTCLSVCERIYSEIVSRGIPVSFVSGNSHVTPFSVFRDYARYKNHPLLNFINCNVAYESYFSNLGSKFANTMCVTDMTLYPDIRAPFMARKDLFERWYEKNKNNSDYIDKAKNLINVNRVGSTSNKKELEIIDYLKEQKNIGKKIICAFGKVPVDLNVPYDGGEAHHDMADWINHTVEICGESENIILLVKPHPHELRPEIALDLVESFHDLITVEVKKNVHLLGHKDINGHALAPYLDLAILYNGSSSLELAAQGIPVLMASYFGKHDYPVELNYPTCRENYREFILSEKYPLPSDELRKKSAFLMSYLGTEEISIINQYSLRQLTNDKIGVPKWRKEKINDFLKNGDPKMRLIADRIVEKFENLSI